MKFMTSKLTLAVFFPVALAVISIKLLSVFTGLIPIDDAILPYAIVLIVLAMFIINIIFCALDRKTSPVYILNRNIPGAIFALLSATFITSKSVLIIIQEIKAEQHGAVQFIASVLGVFAAISLVLVALAHLQGRNYMPRIGAFFLFMPAWACMMLVCEFLGNRTASPMSIDPMKLFTFAFAMIFLFKASMVIATVDGKNPVKSCYLYGLPMAALGLGFGTKTIAEIFVNGLDYSENSLGFAFIFLSLYAVSFTVEIALKSKSKDEQIVKFDMGDIDENQRMYGTESESFMILNEDNNGDYDYDYSVSSREVEDFVAPPKEEIYIPKDYDTVVEDDFLVVNADNGDFGADDAIYIDKNVATSFENNILHNQDVKDTFVPVMDENYDSDERNEDFLKKSRMSEIDKLISDINKENG